MSALSVLGKGGDISYRLRADDYRAGPAVTPPTRGNSGSSRRVGAADVLSTDKVAYWFFRLNGCMTIENFVVHPDFGSSQRTDADILGIRFPHRSEGSASSRMPDHEALLSDVPLLFIAEVKLRECRLNGPWTDPEEDNLDRVLRAVGLHDPSEVRGVAEALYTRHRYVGSQSEVRLYAVGDEGDEDLRRRRPGVVTLLWADVLGFIHGRFTSYRGIKADHQQWEDVGHRLFDLAVAEPDRDAFIRRCRAMLRNDRNQGLGLEQ